MCPFPALPVFLLPYSHGEVYSTACTVSPSPSALPALTKFLLPYGPGEVYSLLHKLCARLIWVSSPLWSRRSVLSLLYVLCAPSLPYLSSSSPMVQARCTLSCMYCVTSSPPSLQSRLSLKLHFSTGTGTLQMI